MLNMTRVRWQIAGYAIVMGAVLAAGFLPGMAVALLLFIVGGVIMFVADPDAKFGRNADLRRLRQIIEVTGHGVTMRVEENRHLMEGLQQHFPAIFTTHAWMADVIRCNDQFFMALATQTCPMRLNNDGTIEVSHGTLRAWPAAVPVHTTAPADYRPHQLPQAGYPLQQLTIRVQGLKLTSVDRLVGEIEHAIVQLKAGTRTYERHDGFVGYQLELEPQGTEPLNWRKSGTSQNEAS